MAYPKDGLLKIHPRKEFDCNWLGYNFRQGLATDRHEYLALPPQMEHSTKLNTPISRN